MARPLSSPETHRSSDWSQQDGAAVGLSLIPEQFGDIGQAAGGEAAGALPEQHAVTDRLGLTRRIVIVPQRAAFDAGQIGLAPGAEVAGAVDLDGDLLADQGGAIAAAEAHHLDPRLARATAATAKQTVPPARGEPAGPMAVNGFGENTTATCK
jgi:hypothetical protein